MSAEPIGLIETRLAELRHLEQGSTLLRAGEHEQALAAFTAALALNPAAATLDLIARCHHRAGRVDTAIAQLERLVADPAKAGKRLAAGERGLIAALRDAGRWDEADRLTERLLARFAASPATIATSLCEADMPLAYPGWMRFFDKGALADSLSAWHAAHPDAEMFWPHSFVLPRDQAALAQFRTTASADTLYVVKPTASSGGKGVTVTRDPGTGGAPRLVQRYLDDPYLIDGKKGHVRLYLLVADAPAPRAYLYREGIVRLAPERYTRDAGALGRAAVHVTNTALHQRHPELVISDDPDAEDVGNIRSLSALLRRLDGDSMPDGWQRLADLARRLLGVVAASGLFASQATAHPRHAFPPLLFGLDVLFDRAGRPWLIECQRSPAITGNALVTRINTALFETTFRMQVGPLAPAVDEAGRREREIARESFEIGRFERLL